jgi:signal transduction histidine kinase
VIVRNETVAPTVPLMSHHAMTLDVPIKAGPTTPKRPLSWDDGADLLNDRLYFERMLARLSSTFINLPAEAIDGQIERGLQQIVDFLGIERSSLGQFSADGSALLVTHSYTVPGVAPFPHVDLAALWPWYTARMRQGEVLRLTRLPDEIPPEAVHEREFYARQGGPRSHLAVPFKVGKAVIGGIGFGSYRREMDWPEGLVQSLKLVGEVFANALARKRAEEREARLREQLARVSRIALLGELAASIAHEVNQPLCAIVSNAQTAQRLVLGGAGAMADVQEALADIIQDGQRASAVLARIRAALQQAPAERFLVDINDTIREVIAVTRGRMAARGLAVQLQLAANLPLVLGDRVQLQQVILNVLVNAADALAASPPEVRGLVVGSAGDPAQGVTVVVHDDGNGIDPRDLERVFEPLFTTKADGMGMGLAICRSIIEAHGGRIWANLPAGGGTTFQFTLPPFQPGQGREITALQGNP